MNILILDSWLREFLDTIATPDQIRKYLSLCGPSVETIKEIENDFIYDVEITTNRIDSVSVVGIAREAAAILPRMGIKARFKPQGKFVLPRGAERLPIEIIDDKKLCKRVLALVMDNVTVTKSDPAIARRLELCGVRALNNLVDITNYVMLETGHPCHVFDYDRIKTGKLIFRTAKAREKMGEQLKTLDGKVYALTEDDVVIDDGTGRVVDLPGIMGTENSVVTEKTKRIVVFMESGDPVRLRRTSLRLGIRTLAATINEKDPDIETQFNTFMQAVKYYTQNCHAKPASPIIDLINHKPETAIVKTSVEFINKRIGISLKETEITGILKSLNFSVAKNNGLLLITPPYYRINDIKIPVDIVEEIARIYGYHNLEPKIMIGEIPKNTLDPVLVLEENLKTMLKYWGYNEIYNYSLISEDLIKKAGLNKDVHLKLENPLTKEVEFLRVSLIPSVLETLSKNQNNARNLNFFELAKVYTKREARLPKESDFLVIANNHDFYKLKGTVETILEELSLKDFEVNLKLDGLFFHPNKYIEFKLNGESVARLGAIHPDIQNAFSLDSECFIAEINIELLKKIAKYSKNYKGLPLFPPVYEDITVITNKDLRLGFLMRDVKKAHKLIKDVSLKAKFENSATIGITFQDPEKNLNAQDLIPVRKRIMDVFSGRKLTIKGDY